jgi:hypothetical protein
VRRLVSAPGWRKAAGHAARIARSREIPPPGAPLRPVE